MTLCGDIEDAYGVAIDPTFFADFATLGDLADGLARARRLRRDPRPIEARE